MVALKQRIAQQWPRFTVGLYAVWGLVTGSAILWLGLQLDSLADKNLMIPFYDSGLGPEEEDRLLKLMFTITGSFMVITNGIALYAAIRKSVWATKVALVVWFTEICWFVLIMAMTLIALLSMSDRDRRELPYPSVWKCVKIMLRVGSTLFHGWALLVYLRDLKLRQRNIWGKLVKTGGVFEYEPVEAVGPLHL
ncbi:hypothetical protein BGX21_007282 [Mortierella sp. AD011]|nr:hypothetical protein BGX20_010765 [Mortierella sp. AD010]KAF9398784.1 hypothetical protein BGX21_007282 [Mortierella sp. AD011]